MKIKQLPVFESGPMKTAELLKVVNYMYDFMLNQYTLIALQQEFQLGVTPTEIYVQKTKLKVWRETLLSSLNSDSLVISIQIHEHSSNLMAYETV